MFHVVHYSTKSTKISVNCIDFERVGNQEIRGIQKETKQLLAE
jgi:hypothetical protein